ncbi:hypothetical protein DS550_23670, partial [Salmonella enterica subsp. enterica serovar Newport]|nr:hypothetical protein [Salmonella enterica]EBR9854146.1 hypothetical protein [Salmonella enterica subsp. enterica serovar Newport]ECG2414347.1 hypothetical protein [Salmonella enterica subsp. enterica serovar Paratyphi C]
IKKKDRIQKFGRISGHFAYKSPDQTNSLPNTSLPSSIGGLSMPNTHVDEGLIVMPTKAIAKS